MDHCCCVSMYLIQTPFLMDVLEVISIRFENLQSSYLNGNV